MTKYICSLMICLFCLGCLSTASANGPFRVFVTHDNKIVFDNLRKNNQAQSAGKEAHYGFCKSGDYLYFSGFRTVGGLTPLHKCFQNKKNVGADAEIESVMQKNALIVFYVKDGKIFAHTRKGIMGCASDHSILFPDISCDRWDVAGTCRHIVYKPLPVCMPEKPVYISD